MERTDQCQTLLYYQSRFERLSLQTKAALEALSLFDQAVQGEVDAKVIKVDRIELDK